MCGRYTLTTSSEDLLSVFGVEELTFEHRPRFNIAPTQDAPVVARDDRGRRMGLMRWGLIPFWADDPSIGNRLINARSETVAEKPAFRHAFRRRRCLVAADGFYEWKKEGDGKVPHWIHRPDRRPFPMAGLWERWEPDGGTPVHTFTILTRDAAPELEHLHPRMPVVLDEEGGDAWLDPERTPRELEELLGRPPSVELGFHPVSTVVNAPGNDGPECIRPVQESEG